MTEPATTSAAAMPPGTAPSEPLRSLLAHSPNAMRALAAIDRTADAGERELAARIVGRALLRAYEAILDARRTRPAPSRDDGGATHAEADIEAEAVRLCSPR